MFAIGLLAACDTNTDTMSSTGPAYVPIYMSAAAMDDIGLKDSRPTKKAGKIYALGNFLFQNELNEGIHIIDVSNAAAPKKVGFLKVPLCTEMAIKNGFLYTNNFSDLLVFNLTAPAGPQLIKRIPKVFPPVNQEYPPLFNVSFECADKSKGVVVGWELKNVTNAKCRR
ncbi:MAG: hypothetical protein EAY75_02610 [Bacteroidetes bacterium]|nr:MAG: hypothetical protein EAY75_02610 [Bacteroidota bacterium]